MLIFKEWVIDSYVIIKQAEIDNRQKAIASLQKEAEQVQAPEKIKKVEQLSTTLEKAWLQRKEYLTQVRDRERKRL